MKLTVELPDVEAMALAQWCKRYTYEDIQRRSANEAEHINMDNGFMKLRAALAEKGFSPR